MYLCIYIYNMYNIYIYILCMYIINVINIYIIYKYICICNIYIYIYIKDIYICLYALNDKSRAQPSNSFWKLCSLS